MTPNPTSAAEASGPPGPYLEQAPLPTALVDGATHLVRYGNPALCRLIGKPESDIVGRPFCDLIPDRDECRTLLDRVYRTGQSATHTAREHPDRPPNVLTYVMWPAIADNQTIGVMIQVVATWSIHEQTLAINEALLLSALRQHELAEVADSSNIRLKTEIEERKQRERDAVVLTHEISHRIKNNLQIVSALIANEVRRTPAEYAQGYLATQARIGAIAQLYDLISQSRQGPSVPVDAYLREIANTMSASLLGETSGVSIEVEAEALTLDPDRAVSFGLLVNELATNAIKHAFPGGIGRVRLGAERIGDEIELTVADNGVGMVATDPAAPPGRHGADYVTIFVRQLRGVMAVSVVEGEGTIVRIRLPLLGIPSPRADRVGA